MTNTIELFSGTKSVSETLKEKGYNIFTTDNNPNTKPTLCKDILNIGVKDLPKDVYFLWASPPCNDYSHAKRKGVSHIELSNMYVIKTLSLIHALKPKYWVIENPQTGTLKFQYFMQDLPYTDIDYCRYGRTFRKRTRLWNNFNFKGLTCNHTSKHKDSCGNGRKEWTSKTMTTYEKGSIPKELVRKIMGGLNDD
jgi:hypothetical protein